MNGKLWLIVCVLVLILVACTPSGPESESVEDFHPEPVGIYARESSSLPPAGGFQALPVQLGGVYLESEGEFLIVYRIDGNEIGSVEYINRPVISDQIRWGKGKDQIVNVEGGAELCVDMGPDYGGPCYKIAFDGQQWSVQSQIHSVEDISEPPAEPIVEEGPGESLPDPENWEVRIYIVPILNQDWDNYVDPPVVWGDNIEFSVDGDWLVTKNITGEEIVRFQAQADGLYTLEDGTRLLQPWYNSNPEQTDILVCFYYTEYGPKYDNSGPCWSVRWPGSWKVQNPGD